MQVDLHDAVPDVVGDLVDRLRLVGAGVVDEDVHAAHLLQGRLRQPANVGAFAHVGDDISAAPPGAFENLIQCRLELVLMPAGNDDVRPGFCQPAGHRLAQPLAAASHERHFA